MLIGLTYDLRSEYLAEGYGEEETAELDRADTIDGIDEAIRALGHQTDRVGHVRQLVARLARGDRWDLVFNICEGLHGTAREATVPALLEAYRIPATFSDPLVLALTLDKGLTKLVVREAGVPTADFAVVRALADLDRLELPFPLFAKPNAEGTGKGISERSRVDAPAELRGTCERLLREFHQPVLLETFLPGDEYTVGIHGSGNEARVLGVMQIHFTTRESEIYSYTTKRDYEEQVKYALRTDEFACRLAGLALQAWNALGCRDVGRIDFRCDVRGEPAFLEVNPLPGLNPVHSDLPILCRLAGMPFGELIRLIVESAARRCGE